MWRSRVWAHLSTHSLPGWCSRRTTPPALLNLEQANPAFLNLGILLVISSLPVRTWSVNWRAVREALRVLPPYDHTVDWSDGSLFPWWVWLANTGVKRDVVNDGVKGVELQVADGKKCVVVHSVQGVFRVSCTPSGKMVITPTPPRYDP